MKRIAFTVFVIGLVTLLSIQTACVGGGEFQIKNLNISPPEVVQGEPATVSADVINVGVSEGICDIILLVDGVETEAKGIKLAPGGSETISFTVIPEECGTCEIDLAGLSGTFMVLEPAKFEVSNLNIPQDVIVGEPATITVTVSNVGPTEGEYTTSLIIDGVEEAVDTTTVALGEEEIIVFTCIKEFPGDYSVQLGELTGTMTVRELIPAEFEVTSLSVSPNPTLTGKEAIASIKVKNTGEADGTFVVELMVDGQLETTKSIEIGGGRQTSTQIPISRDSVGSYEIILDGKQQLLEVLEPVCLDTGTFLIKELRGGRGELEIENKIKLDIIFVLCPTKESKIALFAVYVQAGDSYKVTRIKPGNYYYYYTAGEGWDDAKNAFIYDATYYRGWEQLEFVEETKGRTRYWRIYTFTFESVQGLGAGMPESQFPSLELEEEE